MIEKLAIISETKDGFSVLSENGKNLGGPYPTWVAAKKRLDQVEMFKAMKKKRKKKRATEELRSLCKILKEAGEDDLSDKLLCALSAVTGNKQPRADVTYSSMMRDLVKAGDDEKRLRFQETFKKTFDEALDEDLEGPEKIALMMAMKEINA